MSTPQPSQSLEELRKQEQGIEIILTMIPRRLSKQDNQHRRSKLNQLAAVRERIKELEQEPHP